MRENMLEVQQVRQRLVHGVPLLSRLQEPTAGASRNLDICGWGFQLLRVGKVDIVAGLLQPVVDNWQQYSASIATWAFSTSSRNSSSPSGSLLNLPLFPTSSFRGHDSTIANAFMYVQTYIHQSIFSSCSWYGSHLEREENPQHKSNIHARS
jgi:hypothetical protein